MGSWDPAALMATRGGRFNTSPNFYGTLKRRTLNRNPVQRTALIVVVITDNDLMFDVLSSSAVVRPSASQLRSHGRSMCSNIGAFIIRNRALGQIIVQSYCRSLWDSVGTVVIPAPAF